MQRRQYLRLGCIYEHLLNNLQSDVITNVGDFKDRSKFPTKNDVFCGGLVGKKMSESIRQTRSDKKRAKCNVGSLSGFVSDIFCTH